MRCLLFGRKEGGREEESTNAAGTTHAAPSMRTEHTCCCLGVLVGVSLIAGKLICLKAHSIGCLITSLFYALMENQEDIPAYINSHMV